MFKFKNQENPVSVLLLVSNLIQTPFHVPLGVAMKTHDRQNVKLHMTVLNTKFLLREQEEEQDWRRESRQKESFDARDLLEVR